MNKKILSLVVAAAIAAPMVAQAELKVSGRFYGEMASVDGDITAPSGGDSGHSRLQFDGGDADASVRMAFNMDAWYTNADGANNGLLREFMGSVKLGGGNLYMGRVANAANSGWNDAFTGTFMEARDKGIMKVGSFKDHRIGFKTKAGDLSIDASFGPGTGASNDGTYSIGVAGKMGGINVALGADNDDTGGAGTGSTSTRVAVSGDAGGFKWGVEAANADQEALGGASATTMDTGLFAQIGGKAADMTWNVGYGSVTDLKTTFIRAGLIKNMGSKAKVYAGVTSYDDGTGAISSFGAGLRVDI